MPSSVRFFIILALTALTSCNKQDDLAIPIETSSITFNISARLPDTRSTKTVSISRYVVEIYKTSDPATIVHRVEQASGTVIASLTRNTNYTCIFWADGGTVDDNTNGTFDASNLKNVTLNTGKEISDAFFTNLNITDATTTFNVTLQRATAQVSIIATDVLTASTDLKIVYDQYRSFDASTSSVAGTKTSTDKVFNSASTTGTMGTLLMFASTAGLLNDFTAIYNNSITNTLPSVPIKANYITNVRGNYANVYQNYSIIIILDNNWENEFQGVEINVGTTAVPQWIRVADRNAEKGGTNGATADKTAADYGYYYQWSNATNDPTNLDKAYSACYNFAEGNGLWRLPTQAELIAISGTNGDYHTDNNVRKLKWGGSTAPTEWKLYDERAGMESNFVYFPLSGLRTNSFGPTTESFLGEFGFYWASTSFEYTNSIIGWYVLLNNTATSAVDSSEGSYGISVRCVRDI